MYFNALLGFHPTKCPTRPLRRYDFIGGNVIVFRAQAAAEQQQREDAG